ncbi:hypothetical protein HS1genome_0357 [Sulfodiicoccus acidiphilus]|uniref:Uncharacterized protein n=1 Tax=Sulfodiicoccus acidiphilus TaxID=1670455 RepID=A0A348B1B6_9CREN|nr:hypothetical protein [Sulfodiicoccus acidiphilus]BBD71968.1 hypothetical protein HS1genome_0357 [Sulfodiicoccus acidiphilus]GGT91840.1 hypothetical protein GCM10007116_06950 [Sulfodiicoccus acidiphilus]
MPKRIEMKGRDLEGLVFLGKLKSVNVEYCDEKKKYARVVGVLLDGDEVSTECIPIRAAGKISTVIKHYLRLGVGKYILTEASGNLRHTDTEPEEDDSQPSG